MKKAFTMIELIFVIVILGILAAVAIPRLAATRDDAEIAKASANVSELLNDIGAYYTSQAKFASNLNAMTNVILVDNKNLEANMLSAGKKCIKIKLVASNDNAPSDLIISRGSDEKDKICQKLYKNKNMIHILNSFYSYEDGSGQIKVVGTGNGEKEGHFAVSGISAKF